ncbi:MAG: PQQ-dependent dehydrogenase, methanol/ethanol family [Gammaproteobacteria bacterium]|nr:PQQ-dependent dehydrogenase, methanol/ethanol family [Gammaproteobacteria bacterium]
MTATIRVTMLAAIFSFIAACSDQTTQQQTTAGTAEPKETVSDRAQAIQKSTADIDGARIAKGEPANWLSTGRTYDEQRHSPLSDINTQSISDLGLAWYWDTGTKRGLQATPIVVDGVMFTTGTWSVVWAHDAKTGELLWEFDPQVPKAWARYACCDVVNRGVAAWKGKIYVGTLDGRLIALDAGTGKKVWDVSTILPNRPYTITGAPRIVKDKVIIGNGGAEYGVRGYITAYDAASGDEQWRFFTVPGNPDDGFENKAMEEAAATWRGGKWWEVGGGGTVWDSMAFDADLNLLYIGSGNGAPWNRYIRSPGGGDNLYLSSIIAINPDTGSKVWHYQTTPGDTWDYTATQHMILADLEIKGEQRKVIMQAPKNGFFYVLDRTNGEFISAEAYAPVTWATHVDQETGRPVEDPEAHYANEKKRIRPGPLGGHNWHPMTFHPETGLVYVPALDLRFDYAQDNAFKHSPEDWNLGVDLRESAPPPSAEENIDNLQSIKGYLTAWDPVTQQEVWRVQHATAWNGGLLSTGGNLIFQGRADGQFSAYRADTGELVWESPVHIGIIAAPVSYSVDGEQYITVVAGWGGAYGLASGAPRHRNNVLSEGRILTYKLGGKAELPKPEVTYLAVPTPPAMDYTPEQQKHGQDVFHNYCAVCHGPGVGTSGPIASLLYSSEDTHAIWDAIVVGGAYIEKGMPSFGHALSATDAQDVRAYVIERAKTVIAFCESSFREEYPELLDTACEVPALSTTGGE